jgi:hypothetical protein
VALTRDVVFRWLVGQVRPHLVMAGLSTLDDDTNPDLGQPVANALFRLGISPEDPTEASDLDLSRVPAGQTMLLLLASLIEVKTIVLAFYRSQVNQKSLDTLLEYEKRARGLAEEITADEIVFDRMMSLVDGQGRSSGGAILCGTNIPDAVRIPYRF